MIPQQGLLEISRSRLRGNVALLRTRVGSNVALCATIKADAYGHSLAKIAPLLGEAGISWAAVYSLDEALALAPFAFKVLVLSPIVLTQEFPTLDNLHQIYQQQVRLNLTDPESARRLSALAQQSLPKNARLPIHIQIDTGLTRIGTSPADAAALATLITDLPALRLEGLFSHLSHGDVPGDPTVSHQLQTLHETAAPLQKRFPPLIVHMQNSGGALHIGDAGLTMVRIGIALYGLQPSMADPIPGLLPIARLTAPILAIHDRPAGTGVGYGHTFRTARQSRLAILPVGYADGYPRHLSNAGIAQLCGHAVPIVGRVSMDQIILDVTDIPNARPGDTATVISWNPADPNCLDRMAHSINTIGYELATHLGPRLHRTVIE